MLGRLVNSNQQQEQSKINEKLKTVHAKTILQIETGIDVYAAIVSSIKAFTLNSEEFPSELDMYSFMHDLTDQLEFNDSIIVSFVDTNHIFQYVVTANEIDPAGLQGLDVSKMRPQAEIDQLDELMSSEKTVLFKPINIREGWAAFPFNFSARTKSGTILGYVAPVLNVKYLLDRAYKSDVNNNYVHHFIVGKDTDISREMIYDGTNAYNESEDSEFYKNFNLNKTEFIYSDVNFYGMNLRIGTAYKIPRHPSKLIRNAAIVWYGFFTLFCVITAIQIIRNANLNKKLSLANNEIETKNRVLGHNITDIETLLKEIHHRVKNNMQIVSSLLNLQLSEEADDNVKAALEESKGRIQSMALVHEKLYENDNLSKIGGFEYLYQLILNVQTTLGGKHLEVEINLQVEDNQYFTMDTAVPLGLITNELVTNSYKYAFKSKSVNQINMKILKFDGRFNMTYSDSGPGLPDNVDVNNSNSLGLDLINILAGQLDGTLSYTKQTNTFSLTFDNIESDIATS